MTVQRTFKRLAAAALLASACAIGAPQAQIRGNGPVEVVADSTEVLQSQNVSIWRGNVEVVQNDSRLRCSVLRVEYSARRGGQSAPGQLGDPERYICEGPVWYVTPREVARSNSAVFEVASEVITMTGDVVLRQGQNVAQGDRLTVNTRTNDSRLTTNSPGTGSGRVRSVLYPDSTSSSRPAAAAADAPAASAPASTTAPAAAASGQ